MSARQDMQDNPRITPRREKLLELLAFARDEIQGRLDLEDCPHGGWFTAEDERCWVCSASQECAWLLHNDGVLPWASRNDDDLLRALRFALEVLDIQTRGREHNVQICTCDACAWVRSARHYIANNP